MASTSPLETGQATDLADLARRFKLTRARVTQISNYTLLAPDIHMRPARRFLPGVSGLLRVDARARVDAKKPAEAKAKAKKEVQPGAALETPAASPNATAPAAVAATPATPRTPDPRLPAPGTLLQKRGADPWIARMTVDLRRHVRAGVGALPRQRRGAGEGGGHRRQPEQGGRIIRKHEQAIESLREKVA